LTLPSLRGELAAASGPLGVTGVPNARVYADVQTAAWLADEAGPDTVDGWRQSQVAPDRPAAIDPEDLWALGAELGYPAEIGWSSPGSEDRIDVLFVPRGADSQRPSLPLETLSDRPRPWATYANDPSRAARTRHLVPQLRSYLEDRLPDYMKPSTYVVLDALPLTPNGKVDRRALPAPDAARPELDAAYVAPRTPAEETLAKLWAEVLGLDRVGARDNFFEMGGHSLLATRLIARVRDAFQVDLPLRSLFEAPTPAALAIVVADLQADQDQDRQVLEALLSEIEGMSTDDALEALARESRSDVPGRSA
jgi:acyl carrier protein